ncbi:hypothetical protein BV898_19346 [Hypsibius exemplaris]|uniref:Nuclear receptor domain-containing protein n=1 Tax=Hypsibius exemplaris TaxID=2072580 RepID=A0A9X6NKP5_HYPEX|nr:hypothetical protein BV898_19346 [Hypsibius exemplaris]
MKCQVCAVRRPTGTHYSVSACEGCKAFFRRTLENNRVYVCTANNNCSVETLNEACRACRYRKCLAVGMKVTRTRARRKRTLKTTTTNATDKPGSVGSTVSDSEYSSSGTPEPLSPSDANQIVPSRGFRTGNRNDCSSLLIRNDHLLNGESRKRWHTLQVLELTTDVVFGDLGTHSTEWRGTVFPAGFSMKSTSQSVRAPTLDICKCEVCPERNQMFTNMLPGVTILDSASRKSLTGDWKWMIFWLMRNVDNVVRPEYIETANEIFFNINYFIYNFCKEVEDIGLNQVEKCLLLAVAMMEPDSSSNDTALLRMIHRHYMSVLVETLKQRCSDRRHLFKVSQKVARFFASFKDIVQLHRRYNTTLALLWVIF